MHVLVALAVHGAIRRADIVKVAGSHSIDLLEISDKAATISRWQIDPPSLSHALALNPQMPAAREFAELLRKLGEEHPSPFVPRYSDKALQVPKGAEREGDLRFLFGSPVRTMTLLALEMLGGEAEQRDVYRLTPEWRQPVKNVVKAFEAAGILAKVGTRISFAPYAWSPFLRKLLRAVASAQPSLVEGLKNQRRQFDRRRDESDQKMAVLGIPTSERLLMTLAGEGPCNASKLFRLADADFDSSLLIFAENGLVCSKKSGHSRIYSLNAAHPVYAEFRRLLLSMRGSVDFTSTNDLTDRSARFDVDLLFSKRLRSGVLLMLDACDPKTIDATTMSRMLPEYDYGKMCKALERYESLGVLVSRQEGVRFSYGFNRKWRCYPELKDLLQAANRHWPEWRAGAAVENRMRRSSRRS